MILDADNLRPPSILRALSYMSVYNADPLCNIEHCSTTSQLLTYQA